MHLGSKMKKSGNNETRKLGIHVYVKLGKHKFAAGITLVLGISTVLVLAIPQLIRLL